jgi:hypothetical protein
MKCALQARTASPEASPSLIFSTLCAFEHKTCPITMSHIDRFANKSLRQVQRSKLFGKQSGVAVRDLHDWQQR